LDYNLITVSPQEPSSERKASPPTEQVRRLIERLAFEAHYTAKSPTPDAVHDLRVAIRRLQQGLVTFKVHFPRKFAKKIRKQLKAVMTAAGAVRDCDIAANILLQTGQPGAVRLHRQVRSQRQDAETSMLITLKRLSVRTRFSKWCHELNLDAQQVHFDEETVEAMAWSAVPRLARRFFEAGEAAAAHGSSEKLHAFRILAKKFRYTLELFAPLYGDAAKKYLGEIKSVQSVLGRMNDYRTVLSMAAEEGAGKKLRSALKRAEHRNIGQFRDAWAKKFAPPTPAKWVRTLGSRRDLVVRMPVRASEPPGPSSLESGA